MNPASHEDPANPLRIGESKRVWVVRTGFGQGRGVLAGLAQRHDDPRVELRLPPRGEGDPSAGAKAAPQIGESGRGIGEEHDAEAGDDEIGRARLRRMHGGVGADEAHGQAGGALASPGQHHLRDVDPDDLAARGDLPGEIDRGRAAAAADVDDPLARLRPRRGDEPLRDGAQELVLAVLMVPPAFAARAVPYSAWPALSGWMAASDMRA